MGGRTRNTRFSNASFIQRLVWARRHVLKSELTPRHLSELGEEKGVVGVAWTCQVCLNQGVCATLSYGMH